MVNPVTVNAGIIVPLTGADVDTWGTLDVNPNMVAIDGLFCGVQTVAVSNVNVTLTKPAGFTPTPSPGPTQSQNAVLRFTGVLTASIVITLPIPGRYVVENLTTGNFQLQLQSVAPGQVIGLPQGSQHTIINDGVNIKFVNLGKVGDLEFWAGVTSMPVWTGFCTVPPYLLADGSIYNFSTFPYLGQRLLGAFGGNGVTTFGVPDLRGRVPLAYDGTGTRITVAGCGLNGQTMGAAIDTQFQTLNLTQLPTGITSAGTFDSTTHNVLTSSGGSQVFSKTSGADLFTAFPNGISLVVVTTPQSTGTVTSNNTNGSSHPNVQPSQVSGIYVIKT